MQGLSRVKTAAIAISLATGFGFSGCTSSPISGSNNFSEDLLSRKPDAAKVGEGDGKKLSEAMKSNLRMDPPAKERAPLLQFIKGAIAKRNKSDSGVLETCLTRFKNAPECNFVKNDWMDTLFEDEEGLDQSEEEVALKTSQRSTPVKMTRQFRSKHQKVITEILLSLKKGNFERVPEQIEGDYYRALKKLQDYDTEVSPIVKHLSAHNQCVEPELYAYLGLKIEESFPNSDREKEAISFYEKSDQCNINNHTNKYVQLARFRLGLLSIVGKDCKRAQDVFGRLAKMGVNDYSSRALYWNAYCARSEANRDQFLASFDDLFRMNPLGFHTLSINQGDSILVDNITKPIDPIVNTRTSKEGGQLNVWIQLIEEFDQLGDRLTVHRLLTPARRTPEFLLKLEAGVRLYLSTFAYRSRDMISLFRMLDSVFRTQSEYVVDSTLRLFYPLKYEDSIIKEVKKVNPLIIAALIRQESAFQESARSRVGAMGLMQLMPATARLLDRSVSKRKLGDPSVNIRLGVRYFENLVDRYGGDVELALAAYNAGAEVVDRWQKRYPIKNRLLFLDLIPYAETRNYVTLIGRNYYWYTKIYAEQLKQSHGVALSEKNEFKGLKNQ